MIPLNNLLDSESLDEVVSYTKVEHKTLSNEPYKTDYASLEEIEHAGEWSGEHFDYYFNRYGFRFSDDIPNKIDIGAFGCSFTAGLGLPTYMLWHQLLSNNSLNFGVSGASTKTVMDLFLITSKHIQMDKAVFLLPSYNRIQLACTHPTLNRVSYLSLVPALQSKLALFHGVDCDGVFKNITDEEQVKLFKNDVYLVDHISKERGIKVYMSSWDSKTYEILQQLKVKNIVVLPAWCSTSKEQADTDLARDKKHPGPIHHQQWVDKIKELIK